MTKKIKLLLIILGLVTIIVTGWMMYSRFQVDQLWGHLPLFFFIGLWLAITLSFNYFSKAKNADRILGLSTLSGVVLALGFPPVPLTSLMFLGFIPFLLAEQEIVNTGAPKTTWRVFRNAYHTFVVWNILTTFWVANTAFFAGVFAIWVNSLLMSIPIVLWHIVKKRLPNLTWIAFVAFWLTFEWLHLYHELSWPWLTLGNAFAEFPSWVQWYEYTGVFGGSLWILVANVLFYKVIKNYYFQGVKPHLKTLAKPLALILVPMMISWGIYFTYSEKGEEIEVVVVQPNFEPHYERDKYNKGDKYKLPTKIAFDAATKETDYIVMPESSFNSLDENALQSSRLISDFKGFLRNFPEASLVVGVSSYRFFDDLNNLPPAVRTLERGNKTLYYEAYNAAFQIDRLEDEVQIYHKSLLVPGAEFFPLKNVLPFMKPLVDKLGGSVAGLGKQDTREVFTNSKGVKIAPVICYESVYGDYTTGYIENGAQALFIMTNDGWWDKTGGHKQHMKFASLRAIENRRSIARSANTGISGFINQRGDITQASDYDEIIALNGKIRLNDQRTFYSKWRDLIARLSLFLSGIILLNLVAKTWLKKVSK